MKRVLVTAFEPFGGEAVNASIKAVDRLRGLQYNNLELQTLHLPTVFYKSLEVLRDSISQYGPEVVICIGQAGGRKTISVERAALNIIDAGMPDNEGNQPVDQTICPEGPAAYFSNLPVKKIVQSIKDEGIPSSVSNSAGTYVCNYIFYGLSHMIHNVNPKLKGGFIHIPFLPEQAARHPDQPGMSLELAVRGLQIAIQTAVDQLGGIREA